MNYEELLNEKLGVKTRLIRMPIGVFGKKEMDGKLHNVIDIDGRFCQDSKFMEALKADCAKNRELYHKHQLHFEPVEEEGRIVRLNIEQGNFITLAQLLDEQPSIVAENGFVDNILAQLFDLTEYLHQRNVWHVCYAPQNILIRKGDYSVMLLSHGCFYQSMSDIMELYVGMEHFVAPEVRNRQTVDGRCDIYSLGKLIDYLFELSETSYEFQKVAKKAQKEQPDGRYQSIAGMRKALAQKRSMRHSLKTLLIAGIAALVIFGLYIELMPEPTHVEYVKPTPQQSGDDLSGEGFNPSELGLVSGDTTLMTEEQRRMQAEFEAKAEQIFKKRFMQEADRILSRIYDNEHMNSSEKKFMSDISSVNEELVKLQTELANDAGISAARSQLLATQIVESLTEQKKKKLQYHGIQKKK